MKLTIDEKGCIIYSRRINENNKKHNGTDKVLEIGTEEFPTSLIVNSNYRILEGYGAILDEDGKNCPQIRTHTSRGCITFPDALENGDYVTHFIALGHTGTDYETIAGFRIDVAGVVTDTEIPGVFTISVGNYMNNIEGIQNFDFDYTGNFNSPKITVEKNFSPPCFDTFEDLNKIDCSEGNIAYIKKEKTFYGYNGAWIPLNSK